MDVKQARDYIEDEIRCVLRAVNGICDRNCKKCDLLKNDKELIEAYDLAILALEKQTPKNAAKVDVQPYFRKYFIGKERIR